VWIGLFTLHYRNLSINGNKFFREIFKIFPVCHANLTSILSVDLWDAMVRCKAVPCTEENILAYYFKGNQE
jgi:hypothetical protein